MGMRRDVLIAVVTTTVTIIAAGIVLIALIAVAMVLIDQPRTEKSPRPSVPTTSAPPLPL
ncbi:hypothetical protein A5791_21405 [Mycobacterium sp. 852002-51163_SCH5372311]|nr:hypothetical protein A5791_21405 [Mycobacterium sp. 852002-51163_SCH5372311]